MITLSENRSSQIKVREITDADHIRLARFLAEGLGYQDDFYLSLLEKLSDREVPVGCPRYGYVLEDSSNIVGSILLIFSRIEQGNEEFTRCHVTSWYVEPLYRPFAAIFFGKYLKLKDVTYINVSARPSTIPIIMKQGFEKYSNGQFVLSTLANLALAPRPHGAALVSEGSPLNAESVKFERKVVSDHAKYGCISIWCVQAGQAYPFVFHARSFKGVVPGVQLVYCRSVETFARFARPLSAFLLAKRKLLVRVDANGPIDGLIGKYVEGMEPRFFKGARPNLGDLAYTQAVLCPSRRRGRGGFASLARPTYDTPGL